VARKPKGMAFSASFLVAPPAALAASLAVQESNIFAIFNPEADATATVFMLVMSYLLTFCGLLVIGIPLTLVLERGGDGSLVGAGLGAFAACCSMGAFMTDSFEQLAFLTAGLSSAIFALIYFLAQKSVSAHHD
jgi:hypothetical protein